MKGTITQKLEQQMNRRSFLRGSGLVATAVIGMAAFPRAAVQDHEQDAAEEAKKREDEDKKNSASGDKSQNEDKKDQNPPAEDESKVTLKDESGREYRVCPQCGYNMYRQDRTWTCENCGYSYTE